MIVIIVISLFVALIAAFAIRSKRLRSDENVDRELAPSRFNGLFTDQLSALQPAKLENATLTSAARADLLERSRRGDLETLSEAHSAGEAVLYDEVLDGLVDSTSGSQENFEALVSRISKSSELRTSRRFAERSINNWKASADRRSTAQMMHVVALSDDAAVYERAVELVLEYWRRGTLEQFSAEELIELFDSQYWILAPEARRGGESFALKRKLAEIRRELATATLTR